MLAQTSSDSSGAGGAVLVLILVVIGAVLYFVPTAVAFSRNHPQKAPIFVLNLLAGWTFIGWVGALVWAFVGPTGAAEQLGPRGGTRVCPHCAEQVQWAAQVCKHCGRDLGPAPAVPGACQRCGQPQARPPMPRCIKCGAADSLGLRRDNAPRPEPGGEGEGTDVEPSASLLRRLHVASELR